MKTPKLVLVTSCWCVWVLGASAVAQDQTPSPAVPNPVAVTPPRPRVTPEQYLAEASRMLAAVSDESMRSKTKKNLVELRKDFESLSTKYKASPDNGCEWQPAVHDVERDLVLLVGSGGPEADESKSIPGLPVEVSDPATRQALVAFRTQLELFLDAASMLPRAVPSSGNSVAP